jgi:predicted MFS family arabinose efflux permease
MPVMLANRRLRALFAIGYSEGLLIFGPFAFVAAYFQSRFTLGPGLAGTLVAAYALGGMLYALLARRAVRRLGESGLVLAGGAALTAGYAGLAFSNLLILSTLSIGAVGAGFYMLHTTVQIHVTQVPAEERGSAVALFATFLFLGQASGVWLAARVLDAAGMMPVFLCAALGLAALALAFRYYFLSAGAGGT